MSISGVGAYSSLFSPAGMARLNATPKPEETEGTGPLSAAPAKSARDEFLDYARMSPAEKMRAAMLARLGLKEEDVKAMSAEDRKAVEDKIAKMIKEQVEADPDKRPGKIMDLTA